MQENLSIMFNKKKKKNIVENNVAFYHTVVGAFAFC